MVDRIWNALVVPILYEKNGHISVNYWSNAKSTPKPPYETFQKSQILGITYCGRYPGSPGGYWPLMGVHNTVLPSTAQNWPAYGYIYILLYSTINAMDNQHIICAMLMAIIVA
jgi:hypothetical protein